jgi:outer membrane protein insertion porin family
MKVSSGTSFPPFLWLICLIGGLCLCGCYLPKHYQKGKPFVFKNNIDLQADLPNAEKKDLGRDLALQLDDSLIPQQRDLLFIWHSILYPAAYDTAYAGSSLKTIRYYLAGQGFFSPEVSYSYQIDTVKASKPRKTQYRATTTFHVKAGPRTLLDSIVVSFADPELQRLADSAKKSSLLKRGEAFNADNLQNEIDRLITIYKNHGYYGITRSAFQIELDTINPTLINPVLDPLERIHRFAEESRQQKNPTTDVYLTLSPVLDSALLKRYYIRRVFIYPDYETTRDNRKTPLTGIIMDSVILLSVA